MPETVARLERSTNTNAKSAGLAFHSERLGLSAYCPVADVKADEPQKKVDAPKVFTHAWTVTGLAAAGRSPWTVRTELRVNEPRGMFELSSTKGQKTAWLMIRVFL